MLVRDRDIQPKLIGRGGGGGRRRGDEEKEVCRPICPPPRPPPLCGGRRKRRDTTCKRHSISLPCKAGEGDGFKQRALKIGLPLSLLRRQTEPRVFEVSMNVLCIVHAQGPKAELDAKVGKTICSSLLPLPLFSYIKRKRMVACSSFIPCQDPGRKTTARKTTQKRRRRRLNHPAAAALQVSAKKRLPKLPPSLLSSVLESSCLCLGVGLYEPETEEEGGENSAVEATGRRMQRRRRRR